MLTVVVVTVARFYRDGLARTLTQTNPEEIYATSATFDDAVPLARQTHADVVLVDVAVDNGMSLIGRLCVTQPPTKIVALGVREDEQAILAAVEAGAQGFVPRTASIDQLSAVVRSAGRDEMLCSPRVAGILSRRLTTLASRLHTPIHDLPLTRREREIMHLIDGGLSNKAIARELCIQVSTVKNHVHHILEKLGVQHREDAVAVLDELQVTSP